MTFEDFNSPDLAIEEGIHQEPTVSLEAVAAEPVTAAPVAAEPEAEGPNAFAALGLAEPLVMAVKDLGFTVPTPVQAKTIPLAMGASEWADADDASTTQSRYNDLMVSSQTGSGKTAAYLLPVLHVIHATVLAQEALEKAQAQTERERALAEGKEPPKKPKRPFPVHARHFKATTPTALVLCPTRELAQQVANDAIDLVRHMRGVRIASVVGGLPYQAQVAKLQGASLVVATPGRLLDLQRGGQIKCESVKFLVVDEADRMLDLGFTEDLAEINQLTAERQQTMMFSATFEARIQQLAKRVMREPQRVTIDTPQERHSNIEQKLYWADSFAHKRKVLDHLMRDTTINQAIVFASTQVECDGLAADLIAEGFHAAALHGALSQALRNRRLRQLREGHIQFLVATDVAARGLDVPSITHVFNFGLPMKAEDYVHRIGRTGRAGRDGLAITLAEFRDRRKISDIEFYTKQRLATAMVAGLEPSERRASPKPTRKEHDRQRTQRREPMGEMKAAGQGFDRPQRPQRSEARPVEGHAAPRQGGFRDEPRAPQGGARGYAQPRPPQGEFRGAPRGDSRGDLRGPAPRDARDARGPRGPHDAARGGQSDPFFTRGEARQAGMIPPRGAAPRSGPGAGAGPRGYGAGPKPAFAGKRPGGPKFNKR